MVWVIDQILMKDAVYQLSKEYGFQLTEEDIEAITKQAEAGQRLIQKLFAVDVEGVPPARSRSIRRRNHEPN
jgi:Asp-tRNA(Asn)/Glu-tRNA(Gln) amidotransferase C subunit